MKALISLMLVVVVAGALAQSVTHRTKWVSLPQGARRKLVEKAVTLKSGDSYQSVTNALGTPDIDKGFSAQGQRLLHYNLSRPEGAAPLQNEHSFYVRVYLNSKTDRVQSVYIQAALQ